MEEQLCDIFVRRSSAFTLRLTTADQSAPPTVIEGFRSLLYNSLSFLFPQAVFNLKINHPPIHPSNYHL